MVASAPRSFSRPSAGCTKTIKLSSAVIVLSSAIRYACSRTSSPSTCCRMDGLSSWWPSSFTESFPLFGYSLSDYDELFAEKLDLLVALRDKQFGDQNRKIHPAGQRHDLPPPGRPPAPHLGGRWRRRIRSSGPDTLGLPMALAIIGGRPAAFTPLVENSIRKALEYGEHDPSAPLAVHSHGYVFTDERAATRGFLPAYRRTFAQNRSGARLAADVG